MASIPYILRPFLWPATFCCSTVDLEDLCAFQILQKRLAGWSLHGGPSLCCIVCATHFARTCAPYKILPIPYILTCTQHTHGSEPNSSIVPIYCLNLHLNCPPVNTSVFPTLTLSLPAYHCRQWKSWHIYVSPVAKGLTSRPFVFTSQQFLL